MLRFICHVHRNASVSRANRTKKNHEKTFGRRNLDGNMSNILAISRPPILLVRQNEFEVESEVENAVRLFHVYEEALRGA